MTWRRFALIALAWITAPLWVPVIVVSLLGGDGSHPHDYPYGDG